jgi:hypothetical protein
MRGFKLSSRKCFRRIGDGKAEVAITDIQSGEMMESLNGDVTTSQNPQISGGGASCASQQDQDIPGDQDAPVEAEVQPAESRMDDKNLFIPLVEITQVLTFLLCIIQLFTPMIPVLPPIRCHK